MTTQGGFCLSYSTILMQYMILNKNNINEFVLILKMGKRQKWNEMSWKLIWSIKSIFLYNFFISNIRKLSHYHIYQISINPKRQTMQQQLHLYAVWDICCTSIHMWTVSCIIEYYWFRLVFWYLSWVGDESIINIYIYKAFGKLFYIFQ